MQQVQSPFLESRHVDLAAQAARVAESLEREEDPRQLVGWLAESGLLGACVPAQFGGRGTVELRELCVVRDALAYRSSLADTMFAMQGLGSYPVTIAGSEAQKQRLLPRVVRGEAICAFAITEPEAGSDVSAVATRATKSGDAWQLEGEKCFISNAGIADSYVVFARTSDSPESGRHRGLSAFLVDGAAPQLRIEPTRLIAPHPIGVVRLFACPGELLGEEGGGFALAMQTLDHFRASVGAAALGMARRAFDEAVSRSQARKQFGRALAELQATQMALADMRLDVEAARLLVLSAAHATDTAAAARPLEAAMAKLYATEAAQRVIDRSLQLHGGQGVVAGAVVERLYREVRALRIYEGTSEIQKLVIARQILRTGNG
jgi:acyl-CoA dehydrogenase